MKRFLIIDGEQLLFRHFFARNDTFVVDGVSLGGVWGSLQGIASSLKRFSPQALLVVMDDGKNTLRHQAYPAYKQHRQPRPPELEKQKPLLLSALTAASVVWCSNPDYEGDDIMATAATQGLADGWHPILETRDKDLYHFARTCTLWDAKERAILTPELLHERWGIEPEQFPDFLALRGDKADNIPGVPGVGDKTAAMFLNAQKDLDGVLANNMSFGNKWGPLIHQHRAMIIGFRAFLAMNTNVSGTPTPEQSIIPPMWDSAAIVTEIFRREEAAPVCENQSFENDDIVF